MKVPGPRSSLDERNRSTADGRRRHQRHQKHVRHHRRQAPDAMRTADEHRHRVARTRCAPELRVTAQRSGAQSGQRHRERFGHLVAVEAQSAGLVVVDVRNDRHNGGRVVRLDELTVAPDLVGGAARDEDG